MGHAIFKRMQRLQGGSHKVVNPDPESGQTMFALPLDFAPTVEKGMMYPRRVPPVPRMNTWADYFAALIQQAKEDRTDPDMIWNPPTERPPDEGQRERFQGGSDAVPNPEGYQRDDVFFRPGHIPSSKEASRLYDPGPDTRSLDDEQGHDAAIQQSEDDAWEKTLQRRRETAYKTIGVKINGEEVEIPIWDENMTPEQAEGFARDRLELGLSPFASDMELETAMRNNAKRLDKAQSYSEPTPIPGNYSDGEDDVRLPRRPLTKKELENEDPELRDIIKSIPWREPFKGRQVDPHDVPVWAEPGDTLRYYHPEYSANEDQELLARQGTSSVGNPGLYFYRKQLKKPRKNQI